MSETALAWARTKPAKSVAQKEVLVAMAEAADDDGTVRASLPHLAATVGDSLARVQKTAEGLVQAGWATKSWDPDRYVWVYKLNVVPA